VKPHDFQEAAVSDVVAGLTADPPTPAKFVSSPTGTGKTFMQKLVLDRAPGGLQVVPSMDIAEGFARLYGIPVDRALLENRGVYTAKRLKNLLAAGQFDPSEFRYVQIDEAHHSVDDTHQVIDAFMGGKPRVGWSCTFYRGTPQETQKLHGWWGNNVTVAIGEKDAVDRGFAAAPDTLVLPLVNDETIDLVGGEFKVSAVEAATKNKLEELVQWTGKKFWDSAASSWVRPVMLTLPTVFLVEEAMGWFSHYGFPAVAVTGENSSGSGGTLFRQDTFSDVVARRKLLVQIKVVGEGVDLPMRVLIDAAPTMSPVFWRQRVGRIMRPVGSASCSCGFDVPSSGYEHCLSCGEKKPREAAPLYVCTNHNLMRHGYLLHGVLPPAAFTQARQAWGPDFKPSRRMVARAAGLDGLGRFIPNEIPLANGGMYWLFVLGTKDGTLQFASFVNPAGGDPVWCVREFQVDVIEGHRIKRYDLNPKWKTIPRAPEMSGLISTPNPPWTPKMAAWWKRDALLKGLDPAAEVNARSFQALPMTFDLGLKFRKDGSLS
jgi:hypothetical protein